MAQAAAPNGTKADKKDASVPLTKNAKRRLKKKQQAANRPTDEQQPTPPPTQDQQSKSSQLIDLRSVQLDTESEAYKAFSHVFSRFRQGDNASDGQDGTDGLQKGQVIYSDDEMQSDSQDSDDETPKLSKRKQRKLQRLTVAELKQLVKKPEVVEWTDVTANDPRLLVQLKCQKNTVPVPPHWGQKRDYLQNKRGIEKAAYQLPSYIAATGIATMKDALKEKEAESSLKQKTRERVQPKMGKLDIDYQKLHDAFFKFQHRPELTAYGETYYEGKENETKYKDCKPGDLSEQLKEALSIPPLAPPPWLIAMQRYGPPPSYPHLKIPGLNAPIPDGAQWGFHPGGWGRPPVDEFGRPLYGDVLAVTEATDNELMDPVQKEHWGQLESDEEEEEEEEEDEDEQDGDASDMERDQDNEYARDGMQTPSGLETPSGLASVTSTIPGGLDTPAYVELRKDGRGGRDSVVGTDVGPSRPKQLFQVLEERETSIRGFMGSERGYQLPSSYGPALGAEDQRGTKRKANDSDVQVAIDPSELEGLNEQQLQARFDDARRKAAAAHQPLGNADRESVAQVREELTRQREQAERRRQERHNA